MSDIQVNMILEQVKYFRKDLPIFACWVREVHLEIGEGSSVGDEGGREDEHVAYEAVINGVDGEPTCAGDETEATYSPTGEVEWYGNFVVACDQMFLLFMNFGVFFINCYK